MKNSWSFNEKKSKNNKIFDYKCNYCNDAHVLCIRNEDAVYCVMMCVIRATLRQLSVCCAVSRCVHTTLASRPQQQVLFDVLANTPAGFINIYRDLLCLSVYTVFKYLVCCTAFGQCRQVTRAKSLHIHYTGCTPVSRCQDVQHFINCTVTRVSRCWYSDSCNVTCVSRCIIHQQLYCHLYAKTYCTAATTLSPVCQNIHDCCATVASPVCSLRLSPRGS